MKQIIFICLLLLTVTSCKKKTTVTIQAQDYITGEGTAYAGREYAVSESWTPFLETKSKIVATGFLDDNGQASFDLKMKNNRKYILGVSQPNKICEGGVVQHYLEHEKNNVVNFKYAHCAYLKLILNGVDCFNNEDEIKYTRTWITNNDEGSIITRLNCYSFVGDYFELPAGDYRYDWEVTKSGTTTYHSESFTLGDGDSLVFQIDY